MAELNAPEDGIKEESQQKKWKLSQWDSMQPQQHQLDQEQLLPREQELQEQQQKKIEAMHAIGP